MIATWTTSQKVPKKTTNYDVISFSEIVSRHFYVLIKFLFWDKISPFGDHKKVWWRAKRILSHKIWKCHQELRVENKPLTNPELHNLHLCQHGWSLGAIGLYATPITFSHAFVPLQLLRSLTTKCHHHKFDGICCFPKSVSFNALTCCKSNMMKALSWIATLKGAKLEVPCVLHEGQFRFFIGSWRIK